MGRWFAYTGNADKIVIDYFEVAWAKGSRWDKNALLMGPDWRRILDEQFPGWELLHDIQLLPGDT